MKKDKKWLKNQIEIMGSETSENYPHDQMVDRDLVIKLVERLDEPDKVVIPQFVADYIEFCKGWNGDRQEYIEEDNSGLWLALEGDSFGIPNSVSDWLFNEEKVETFARAWLDGFIIANEDEELWKPIENYEGLYEISNKGNVKSLDRDVQYKKTDFTMKIKGVDLKPNVLKKGYLQVALSKSGKTKSMLVHRLVMNAFNPTTDENLQINHIDGDKENNEVSNLEWVTAMENTNHAYDIGLRDNTIGNNQKLTEDEVLEIIDLYETGNYTQKELGNKYNVGRNTIGEILLGKAWGWLTGIIREVEKEKLYRIELPSGHVMYNSGAKDKPSYSYILEGLVKDSPESTFTEKEIKDHDPRFMAFALEVAE